MPNSTSRQPVVVVTDSAADLPQEWLQAFDIQMVPLILTMGNKSWRDRVDITPPQFYELLRNSSDFPKTSQPNASTFQELFVQLSQQVEKICAVLVSSDLSGTVSAARTAKANLPDLDIQIVDSRGVSMMQGFTVLAAARAAAQGLALGQVAAAARAMIGKAHIYFIVDTFEYLYRGGRIGAVSRLLGSALNIKPVLEIADGVAKPAGQVRTRRKALARVIELLEQQAEQGGQAHMAVVNVAAAEEAQDFRRQLEERFQPVEMISTDCSPVLGAHVGPGTIGVAYHFE
jgi:DegV family protein with EDD domain